MQKIIAAELGNRGWHHEHQTFSPPVMGNFLHIFHHLGYLPTASGNSFFQSLISQYARLDPGIEMQLLSGFIVPACFVGAAWFATGFVIGQRRK